VEVEQISYLELNYDMSIEGQEQLKPYSYEAELEAETHICEQNIDVYTVSNL
jgi:hypothetical protein